MTIVGAAARSASLNRPTGDLSRTWKLDAATLLGFTVLSAYVLPARLVVSGLGAAGRPALVLGAGFLTWWLLSRLVPASFVGGRNPVRVAVLGFSVAFLISYLLGFARAMQPAEVTGADRAVLRFAGLVGITLVVCDGVRTRARLDTLIKSLLAGGAFMAVVGSMQFLLGIDITPRLRLPGTSMNGDLIGIAGRGDGFNRVAGTAGHFIEFGVLLCLLTPLALHYGLHAATRRSRALYLCMTGLFVLASFYSVSRSAVVALAVVALFAIPGWTWRRKLNFAALGLIFILVVQTVQPGLLGTLRSLFKNFENDPSIEGRTNDYAVVSPLIDERPWFGRGPGTYSPENYTLLDNQWLGWLVTGGLIGVLTLLALFGTSIALAGRVRRWAAREEDRNLARALAAALTAGAVISLTFDSFSFTTFAVTVFLLFGLAGALWRLAGRPEPTDRPSEPGIPR